ncbi:sigma-70 family RNA polymerase sigma factor [Streptomyces sp. NPDC046831]|uniref:sigma-70 family RNA polymerase sigma factor n=1 Tax=Streptomyces sp. NPDC046831 TaxID=3154805 RepID=UPI0033D89B57
MPVTKAALAELLVRLRRATVDGVVPDEVFMAQAQELGLGDAERERLRGELARLRMPVQKSVVHTDVDPSEVKRVVRGGEENVFPRLEPVLTLLSRYADADGYVTPRAVAGVVRLAGLDRREEAALRTWAKVRQDPGTRSDAGETSSSSGQSPTAGARVETAGVEHAVDRARDVAEEPGAAATGDIAAAVTAALAVLRADRSEGHPERRLLSAETEVGLGVLVRGGADRIGAEPDEEELKALPSDDLRIRARDCLVVHNLRLVHSLVRGYLEQGLDYDDLFQHGCLGLMRAARKFDPAMGNKFSTYATWWVRQALARAIADEGALIRIPVHMHEQMRKVARAERTLAGRGRPATAADVAVLCDLTLQKVEEVRRLSCRTDSLDRVIGDGATLADFVGRTRPLPAVEQQVVSDLHAEAVMAVVDTFAGRDHRILVRRLGLDGDEPSTLDELGREFGVSRERIRQLEVKLRPELMARLRGARLVGVDEKSEREEAERAAARSARAAQAVRAARAAQAARAARVARAAQVARSAWAARSDQLIKAPGPLRESAEEVVEVPASHTDAVDLTASNSGPEAAESAVEQKTGTDAEATVVVTPPAGTAVRDGRPDDAGATAEAVGGAGIRASTGPGDTATGFRSAAGAGCEDAEDGLASQADAGLGGAIDGPAPVTGACSEDGAPAEADAADWERALRMAKAPSAQTAWLAGYVLAGVGHQAVASLLGQREADAVARCAAEGEPVEFPVLTALEVLRRVLDAVASAGQRPEDFFDRPAEALCGATPRSYLENRSLVHGEPRLAVRDALREYVAESAGAPRHTGEKAPGASSAATREAGLPAEAEEPRGPVAEGDVPGVSPGRPADGEEPSQEAFHQTIDDLPAGGGEPAMGSTGAGVGELAHEAPSRGGQEAQPPESDVPRTKTTDHDLRREFEAREHRIREEYESRLGRHRRDFELQLAEVREAAGRRLAEQGQAADQSLADEWEVTERRISAVRTEAERELDSWEEALLRRMDKTLLRREEHIRAEAETRIAALRGEHRAAYRAVLQRAEKAEEAARRTEHHQRRAHDLELRLRQYREEAETRIAGLEARLRETEEALAQRDQAVEMARRHAEATEHNAAQRIAHTEHNAWARIAELQQQLTDLQGQPAAASEAAETRGSFRDRWRRP